MTVCLGFFSQFYLRRHRPRFFRKYNYLVSAALDGGTQLFVFIAVSDYLSGPEREEQTTDDASFCRLLPSSERAGLRSRCRTGR